MSNMNHTVITQCVALGWPTQESLLRRPPSGVLCPVLLYGAFGFLGFHSLKQGLRLKGISLEAKTLRRITSHYYEFRKEAK